MFTSDLYVFLDSDVIPQIDAFRNTLASARVDEVTTGLYPSRGSTNYAAGFIKGATFSSLLPSCREARQAEFVHWAGGGLLFVGADVLSRIPYPFFREGVVEWKDERGCERADTIGEDVMFCSAVTTAGFRIRVDYDCVAQHLTADEQ